MSTDDDQAGVLTAPAPSAAGPADLPADGPALRDWLGDMLLIRTFEETADGLALRGKVPGGMHPAIGQEAVAVGIARGLRDGDVVAGTHRSHHHALAKHLPPDAVMAELYGKRDGANGGRGGSMHLADFDRGLWGTNGIVGAGLGIALGGALGSSILRNGSVAVGLFGDGGANTGRTWEFVNLAAVWNLPLVVVCENNLYAVETASKSVTGGTSVAERAAGFGLPSHQVDGQDVLAVQVAVRAAADRARSGAGPTFLEMLTYRYKGHNSGEVVRYRTEDEVLQWRSSRDPVERFSARLTDAGLLTPEQLTDLADRARRTIDHAVTVAEESPWPDPSTAAGNVSAWSDSQGYTR
ncbi:thiamine pyrophosphate-dependent dehydrogenase E1 component subunit alpha [Nakamurella endophytica]|uniref:Acetoin:2,6-dichlorophenolindophenol oxidoreductase subunit alpha n=1 Tax=Nakamurella endophytica TaxID=1748367 RepID=A0A917WED0_9ACTN|nr:thiamine pyrophosphate-dependent dehydrogenase E1 component subunit alpha [Nakamurella endophytica]GGL99551.1 acetoin:2,6-dichlorophenolindophenol oxidoreductase subunit alpha [Nakamurella endophytica]